VNTPSADQPGSGEAPVDPAGDTTIDALMGGRVQLEQPRRGYRVAVDPVLLAAACPVASRGANQVANQVVGVAGNQLVLDAGCGTGAAALCLAARVPGLTLLGLEVQPLHAALARANAARNGLGTTFTILEGDLARPPKPALVEADHVISNPPFAAAGAHTAAAEPARAVAHGESSLDLEGWIAACLRRTRSGGSLTLIHTAGRLDAILAALAGKAGAVEVLPIWPRAGAEAKRVIVRARKGGRSPARLLPGLVLHREDGSFTDAAEAVLRHGVALDFAG
jgi:tRNA1(Val) A37 N6-methylase TrmN6